MEIRIEGDFSTEEALSWKKKLNEASLINSDLKIDLSQSTTADIVGINALATSFKISNEKGHQFELRLKRDSEIYNMLHLTKFLEIIPHKIV